MNSETSSNGFTRYYIGEDDCKKATCNKKQEFPRGDDPYCLRHSLEDYYNEEPPAPETEQEDAE